MSDHVKLEVDLRSGTLKIEAPADSLDAVFDKLTGFLPSLADAYEAFGDEPPDASRSTTPLEIRDTSRKPDADATPRKGRTRDGKKETYKPVDLGLTEAQRQEFRDFFKEKDPKGQNDTLLTIMYWLQNTAGKASLDRDELFTGFRTVEAEVPGRITSVLSNLRIEGKVVAQEAGKFSLHHTGEDYVKFKLPKGKAK